ncbi:MAG: glycosyltransferase family 4 protein [Candidatus Auribacterota bacterium]|nr:glycosyltransferase family 4 protein [Candidatus Auribacterota bacterium]
MTKKEPIKPNFTVVYPINIRFPMERANSVQIAHTCRELAQQGVRVYLLVRRTTSMSNEQILAHYGLDAHKNLIIKRIPVINWSNHAFVWNKSFYAAVLLYILWLLCTKKIDCFFLRDLGIAKILIPLRKIFGFKVLYETHIVSYIMTGQQHELFPDTAPATDALIRKIESTERFVMTMSDHLIAITDRLKTRIIQLFDVPDSRISVLPDGVDLSVYKTKKHINREGLVYVGQLYPWKGAGTLIDAMQYIESTLTVVGGIPFEDDLEQLRKRAENVGVIDKIRFTGFVPHGQVADYLMSAQISVIPLPDNIMAREYTSPLKLFESMGAGTAVVASDLPSIREIITDRKNGMLFTPEDPVDLARTVNELLNNRELAKNIVDRAAIDVKQYTWQKRTEHIVKILKNGLRQHF